MRIEQARAEDLFPVGIIQDSDVAGRGIGWRFLHGVLEEPRMPRPDCGHGLLLDVHGDATRDGLAREGFWRMDEHSGRNGKQVQLRRRA